MSGGKDTGNEATSGNARAEDVRRVAYEPVVVKNLMPMNGR